MEAKGIVDPEAIAARFAAWHVEGRITGTGASTLKALRELAAGGHWALVGRKGEYAAGNGAAMRAAPLAFVLDPMDAEARRQIRDVSRITHHSDEAYAGALAVVVAVRLAVSGCWCDPGSLEAVARQLPDSVVRDRILEIGERDLGIREAAEKLGSSGYVAESVPLALLGESMVEELGFEAMVVALVSSGGDTDTVVSIAGQARSQH